MSIQLQLRRGTAAQNNAFTGAAGEVSVNLDTSSLRVHDGITAGGLELARSNQIDSLLIKSVAGAADVTLTTAEAANSNHEYTGVLTGNINVIVPAVSHNFTAENLTTGNFTLTVKTPAGSGIVVPQGYAMTLYCNGVGVEDANSAKVVNGMQDFRLTLTSLTPVTTTDVSGATTIYAAPYTGNQISLFTGTSWVTRQSEEFSIPLGTLTANRPYDVFCYDNAGIPTLELLAWTNDTTRATTIGRQNGVLVKGGAETRRYLGTFYTTSTTTTEDSEAKRLLWNYYHRVRRGVKVVDGTASWTYSTSTYRQANGSATNQIDVMVGVAEDSVEINVSAQVANSTATKRYAHVGVGINSTIVNSATTQPRVFCDNTVSYYITSTLMTSAILGKNSYIRLELAEGTDVQTWIGSGGSPLIQTAIFGEVSA